MKTEQLLDLTKSLPNLTPKEIVAQLDHYIIGQTQAKRACAIALRNRRRRQMVTSDIRDEILPKNILMIGPTGVGKTEIARRLAKLAHSPFIKVEATKFTEVGYVGRDVESLIRDLMDISINMVKEEQKVLIQNAAHKKAIEKVLDMLFTPPKPALNLTPEEREAQEKRYQEHRDKLREQLIAGALNERTVEMDVTETPNMPTISVFNGSNVEEIGFNFREMLPNLFGGGNRTKRKKITVEEALQRVQNEEEQKLIDMEQVQKTALDRVQNSGIVFIDEIDKIAAGGRGGGGPDVSRQGVQRDLLPIIEGSTVNTKYGMVRTDHILFIAAGAFHVAKTSDLLPELQGRLPIQVELEPLTEDDFFLILKEPSNSLIKQNKALLETEQVSLEFTEDGVRAIAQIAFQANESHENIGARRLHAVMEKVMEDLFFDASDMAGEKVLIDRDFVEKQMGDTLQNQDLKRYIL